MSSPYVILGDRPLDQWKVTELKEELKRRKLTIKGLKEDLIKRLDEAVRDEWESDNKSTDNNLNEVNQSDLPSEQTTEGNDVPGRAEDLANTGDGLIGKLDSNPEIGIDHDRELPTEDKLMEVNLGQEIDTVDAVAEQVSRFTEVETAVVVKATIEPVTALSGSLFHIYGQQEKADLTRGVNHDGVESTHENVTAELSDPYTQMPRIDESSMTMLPPGELSLKGSEVQNEATVSMDPLEIDNSKCPQPDHRVQQLKYQVSEVEHPHLGSQVITDSVSTEPVSIIEKNELKLAVINDNVELELDVDREIAPPPSIFTLDCGETHPMDVEGPVLHTKVVNEEYHIRNAETVDSPKNIDGDELGPEKLSFDRSSGDDSMEEYVLESKQMEYKSISNQTIDLVEKSELLIVEEDNIVDIVGGGNTVEAIVDNTEDKKVAALTSVKRKFDGDNEAVGNNDTAKRPHRWKVGGLKGSERECGSSETPKTPKGSSQDSQTSISRFNTSDSTNNEAPTERIVPPSSKLPSNSLRIDRFLRPFTLKAVHELLGTTGTVTSFWMDHIKTHCYVSYSSIEEAVETRNAVYNLQWPPNGGRMLVAEFVDPHEVKTRVEAPPASPATPSSTAPSTFSTAQLPLQPQPFPRQQVPTLQLQSPSLPPPPPLANAAPVRERQHSSRVPLPREQLHMLPSREHPNLPPPPPLPEKIDPPIVTLDDLFRKTISTPRIYYLPLSDEQVTAKLNSQGKNV